MSSSEFSSKESVYISCSDTINIIDNNELGVCESADLLSQWTFLHPYENQIRNLLFYYESHKIKELNQINLSFFSINYIIIDFINRNLNEMEEFINDYVDKYKLDKDRISILWKSLKEILLNDLNIPDNENIDINNTANNVKQFDKDFSKFFMCLINENVAYQNGIDYFNLELISEKQMKFPRSTKEFARVFIIFILDMPAHVIVFDEQHPFIELKIYLVEVQWEYYDNDVISSFIHKDCKLSCSSLTCSEDASNECQNKSYLPIPDNADISSQEKTNGVKESLDRPNNFEFDKSEESCKLDNLSTNISLKKYYTRIRLRLDLNHNARFLLLEQVKIKKPSIWLMILKVLFSFSSIFDMILDILLAFTFLQSGQISFSILTIAILIITGTINVFLEKNLLKRKDLGISYLPNAFNYAPLRYFCSFFQLSAFLGSMKFVILFIKAAKEEEIKILLKLLCGHNIVSLQYISKDLKYIERYLEALPQILLQIYIVLTTKQWVWMQLVSIASGMANIQLTTLAFAAMTKNIHAIDVWKHPVLILTTFSYNGSLITSHSFLFWQFHWIFGLLWIALHVLISYIVKCNKNDDTVYFFKCKIIKSSCITIFNKITVIDHIIILCIFILKLDQFKDPIFIALFLWQIIFSLIWIMGIYKRNFNFHVNVMFIPHFVKNHQ